MNFSWDSPYTMILLGLFALIFMALLFRTPSLVRARRLKLLAQKHLLSFTVKHHASIATQAVLPINEASVMFKHDGVEYEGIDKGNIMHGQIRKQDVFIYDVRGVRTQVDIRTIKTFASPRTILQVSNESYVLRGGFAGYASVSVITSTLEEINRGKVPSHTHNKPLSVKAPFFYFFIVLVMAPMFFGVFLSFYISIRDW